MTVTMFRTRQAAAALFALGAVLAVLTVPGCGMKKENEQLKSEKTQLTQDKQKLQTDLTAVTGESTEMQATLDEVQKSLEDLRARELKVVRSTLEVVQEGKPRASRREKLKDEMESLKKAIRENLDKLARLEQEKKTAEKRAGEQEKKSIQLGQRVTAMERLVGELRASLEEKEKVIAELETKVLALSQTVEQQAGVIKEKEGVIDTQTKEINKAYVALGAKTNLKKKGLVEKKGSVIGMGGRWVRTGKFDPEVFREIDVTKEKEFPIAAAAKKVTILSDHPADSYEMAADGEKACILKVLDPARFWRGSKYLVVMIPD